MPKTFDEALLEFQKLKVQASKGSKNPHFKSQYASLEDVMRACDEGNQFGLVYSQPLDLIEIGGQVLQVVVTKVTHVPSGETRQSPCPIRSKDPNDPQKMGSGITYAKRYALQAFYGLCSDDDGNLAATPPKENLSARSYIDPNTGQVADIADDAPTFPDELIPAVNHFIEKFKELDPEKVDEIRSLCYHNDLVSICKTIKKHKVEDTGNYKELLNLRDNFIDLGVKLKEEQERKNAKGL